MEPIDLKKISQFQKDIEDCFKKWDIEPSFCFGNDYSLSFVYEKYVEEETKALYKKQLKKWFMFISFLLIVFRDSNPSTKKYITTLYNSIENTYLLINFLRISSAFAVLRGVYENILKLLFALYVDPAFDFDNGTLKSIKDLRADLERLNIRTEFIGQLFQNYGDLCDHSHISIFQSEQILQEDYIQKLILELNDCEESFRKTIDLCNSYFLMLFPHTFYKYNDVAYASTDLIRRVEGGFFWGINLRFYYIKALPEYQLKEIVKMIDINPKEEHEVYNLGVIYLMIGMESEAYKLLIDIVDSQYFTNNPGCYITALLSSELNGDGSNYSNILEKTIDFKMNNDYMKPYFETFAHKYSAEMTKIRSEIEVRIE